MRPMKNDRGFTLIELIVVMLIMAILAVGSMAGFNLLRGRGAKDAAEQIMTVLDYVQIENMTKSKTYLMRIEEEDRDTYKLSVVVKSASGVENIESTKTLSLKDGRIIFYNNSGSAIEVTGDDRLEVSFRKDTGGVKEYDLTSHLTVTRIGVTASGRTSYIRLVTATGKHFLE